MAKFISRVYQLEKLINKDRALIIYGPRRIGKTTLLNEFLKNSGLKSKLDTGDNIRLKSLMESGDLEVIGEYVEGYELIAIDEAQQIEGIGLALKMMVGHFDKYIVATGSSSFDLSQTIGEPLTGRKRTIILFPLSQMELSAQYNKFELREQLEDFLIFGSYPEVLTAGTRKEKIFILKELSESYLLKDILSLERIKASHKLLELLKLLAFQIGNEVSFNELAARVGLDVKTVARYLDFLEKGFVIKRIGGFSRNLRNEISTKAKYYFLDNGIRNAIINQFNLLTDRDDHGALFENFIVMERMKYHAYHETFAEQYFWRTHQQEEIDLVEEFNGKYYAFEIKWSEKRKASPPKTWAKTYQNSVFQVIHTGNYLDFLL